MKERTKRLCDSIIALSLAVSVLSSAAAIKTYSARLDVARPGVTAFAASYTDNLTSMPGYNAGDEGSDPTVTINYKIGADGELVSKVIATGEEAVNALANDYTVQISSLNVPKPEAAEGKEFKGWALTAERAAAGETDTQFTDGNLDDTTVTLYAVFVDKASEESSEGEQEQGTGDGEGEQEQEEGLTDEQKAEKNAEALEKIEMVQDAADAAQAALKKENPDREALVSSLDGKDTLLDEADALLKETKGGTDYQLAVSKLATAKTALKNAKEAVFALPSAADKEAVETLNQKYGEIKILAEAAEAAVKADGQNTSQFDGYKTQIDALYTQIDSILDGVDNAAYVSDKTNQAATAAQNAVVKAQRAYASVVYVAKDDTDNRYTWSQLRSHVESLPSNNGAVVDALASIDGEADQKFAKGYKMWWETTSGKKVTFLGVDDGDYVNISNLGLGSNTVKSSKCYSYDGENLTEEESGEIAYIDGTYQARVFVVEEGVYVFAGNYYPKEKDSDDNIVAAKADGTDGVKKGVLEKDIEDGTGAYITITPISASSGTYQGIASKLKGQTILAMYDISLKGDRSVLPRQKVKVTRTELSLKNKKVDVYHIVGTSLNPIRIASGVTVDKNGKFSFETDGFSPFAVTEYTPASSSSGDSSSTGTGLTSPRTGEGSPLPFVLAAVGALGVAGGVVVWRKKKTAQD